MAEMAIFREFTKRPELKIVYISPLRALARERMVDWKQKLQLDGTKMVLELVGDYYHDQRALGKANIIITTPDKWDRVCRLPENKNLVSKVSLVIIDEIHLLG
jgi:activating signal cointegrator complex subunit 3